VEENGWYLVATRGSHRQFKHADKPGRVTIAGKLSAELHPKTRASILRQAGLVGDGAPIPDPTGPGVYLERHVDAAA
jgi:predicted RNA binding protein YcfA (HicA-like mRNA interferase family)